MHVIGQKLVETATGRQIGSHQSKTALDTLEGALGLSRRDTLAYKPLTYTSLPALIQAYRQAYSDVWHTLVRVRLSRPIQHDRHSVKRIAWRHFVVLLRVRRVPARTSRTSFGRDQVGAAVVMVRIRP